MRFVDLFCGAGLLSYGFVKTGFVPVFAADLDPDAVTTYNNNITDVARVCDVSVVNQNVKADVVLAGPPCQGFSTLGRRDPKDVRNNMALVVPLWAEAVGAKIAVVENVPQFLKSLQWQSMANHFLALGYELQTWVLNAADFGTPQIRKRAFTIASKVGKCKEPKKTQSVLSNVVFNKKYDSCDPMHVWPNHSGIAYERISKIPAKGSKLNLMVDYPELCPQSWFKLGKQACDVWGRIDSSKQSNTIRCTFQNPSKGRYLHPSEDRVISLREGACLQGIPETWIMHGSNSSIARQIGNGVPVPLSEAIAKEIKSHLDIV